MRRFLFLLFLLPQVAPAQRPIIDDFFLFETAEPVKVYAIRQDQVGFMWIATSLGLYHFNGQGDLTTIPDVLHQPATAVALFDNEVYVGYANGDIGRVVEDSVIVLRIQGNKPRRPVNNLLVTGAGIWAATDDGLYAIINNQGFLLDKKNGLPENIVYTISPSADDGLLLGTRGGIVKLNVRQGKAVVTSYTAENGLSGDSINVLRPVPHTNYAWAGAGSNGISRVAFNGDNIVTLPFKRAWQWGQVRDILVLSATHAWAGTENGYLLDVYVQDSIIIKPYHYANKSFNTLLYTKAGAIWAGTNTGLTEFSAGFAAEREIGPPYNMNELTATACDRQNNLWFAELNELYKMPLSRSAAPEHVCSLPAIVSCLYVGTGNELWIGTAGGGLWELHGNRSVPVANSSRIKTDTVFSISGSAGHLWLSSSNGIDEFSIRQDGLQLFKHHEPADIGTDRVFYLYNDSRNRMWMATNGAGVCMYDNHYHRFGPAAGLSANAVCTITEDSYGHIWAGTLDHGVSRYDGKTWRSFEHKNGLQNLSVSAVTANATGQVIIINGIGVDEWFPGSAQFRHYNFRTTPSIDSISYALNIAFRDTAGNVYVPGLKGLLQFKNTEEPVELKPSVMIEKVSVFQKEAPFGKHEFLYKQNNISFGFAGINFTNYERLHYRYKLEGYNDDWVLLSEEHVTFPQLNAGNYTFRIQAALAGDFEGAVEDRYAFTVLAPLWLQPWFMILVFVSIAAIAFAYVRWRERNLKKMAQLKQERALFEYELFKSQVNPHFLFNSLNILTNLIDENHEHAVDYTVQLSALYRNILTYRSKDTILLSEECKLLDSYMHVQRRRFGEALRLDTNIPRQILDTCRIIPLALQSFIENAIKHNMLSLENPLTVRIYVSDTEELIVRNPVRPKARLETGAGVGLQNICKRYGLLTKKPVWHGITDGDYVVKLPLL